MEAEVNNSYHKQAINNIFNYISANEQLNANANLFLLAYAYLLLACLW